MPNTCCLASSNAARAGCVSSRISSGFEPKRTQGNSRRYSEEDVARLRRIAELTQEHGLNLAGVRIVMDLERQVEDLRRKLERSNRQLAATEKKLQEARSQARTRGVLVRLSDVASIFDQQQAQFAKGPRRA